MANVELRELTKDSYLPFIKMQVAEAQKNFVASNAASMAQAHFHEDAWFRGIYSSDEPVGFVMLSIKSADAEYWVWRLMIAADHQRKGYGKAAMDKVVEHVRTLPNAKELFLSHVEANTEAAAFYSSLGFTYTGKKDEDGELEMVLTL